MITFSQLGNPRYGRLGNQLFQIAATIGIAKQNGHLAVFPTWAYAKYFAHSLPKGVLHNTKAYRHTSVFYKKIDLPIGNWDLHGFFTSEKFFEFIASDIRKQFEPSTEVTEYINRKYGSLLINKPCSIHIRRGDYVQLSWDFPTLPIEYYQHAIKQFPGNTLFLVFSDDIRWCKQYLVGENFVFIEDETDIIDLILMSRCQNHIIANSTFSWWGAWLNGDPKKIVTCPFWWFGPGMSARPQYYAKDLYAKGFEPLTMPGENIWYTKTYYFIMHPFYKSWSKLYGLMMDLYSVKIINRLVKKLKA